MSGGSAAVTAVTRIAISRNGEPRLTLSRFGRAAERRPPLRRHRAAPNLLAPQIDAADAPRVADAFERTGIQDQEIGTLAGRDRTKLVEPHDSRRVPRPHKDSLHGRESRFRHQKLQLDMRAQTEILASADPSGIGSQRQRDSGRVELRNIPQVRGGPLMRPLLGLRLLWGLVRIAYERRAQQRNLLRRERISQHRLVDPYRLRR